MSKVYLVGGAVRDLILGIEPHDRDYVVVGSTEEEMLAKGYTKVGAAFPVFLHPITKEEYALARTEVSTGPGYNDFEVSFTPEVTIEEDLERRDLTINAIAMDIESGEFIDPFGGITDIEEKVIRAVNVRAMEEDPLRIFRAARFFSKFRRDGWVLEPTTLNYMWKGSCNLIALPKERKFAELEKVLSCRTSFLRGFFDIMIDMGEFHRLQALIGVKQPEEHHPEGDAYVHSMLTAQHALDNSVSAKVVFAALCHDLGKVVYWVNGNLHGHEEFGVNIVEDLCRQYAVPNKWRDLAVASCREHGNIHRVMDMSPRKVYDLIHRLGGDKPDGGLLPEVVFVAMCDAKGRGGDFSYQKYPQSDFLMFVAQQLRDRIKTPEFKENNRFFAEKYKGRPDLIADLVRQEKISIVKQAIKYLKGY